MEHGAGGIIALLALLALIVERKDRKDERVLFQETIKTLTAEKDAIRVQQIGDTRIALEAVAKSTDNLEGAETRMVENNTLVKELITIFRSQTKA